MAISLEEYEKRKKKKQQEQYNIISLEDYQKQKGIKSSLNNENKSSGYFKSSSLFDDGYDFGDITKTVSNTGSNAVAHFLKGGLGAAEGITDFVQRGAALAADLVGAKNVAQTWRNAANKDISGDIFNPLMEPTKNKSVFGDSTNSLVEGVGNYAGKTALQGLGVPWQLTSGAGAAAQSLKEAEDNGASNKDAVISSLVSAAGEIGSEYLFSGLGKLKGTGALDDVLVGKLTKKIKNNFIKNMAQFGLKSAGEGIEEIASGYIDALGKKATYMDDKKLSEIYSSKEAFDDFVAGTLVSAISGVVLPGQGNVINNIKSGRSILNGLTQDEQKTFDNEVNKRYNETLSKNTEKLSTRQKNQIKTNIEEQVYQDLFNDKINIRIDTNTDNDKINQFRKSANQYWNNSKESIGARDIVEKVIKDKNYNITLDPNITTKSGKIVAGRITTNKNGEVDIRLNPNSDRTMEFLLTHEITHAIDTKEMRNLVIDYASKNKDFDKALDSLKQTYETNDVNDEVLADISGQLLGNQEFILSLSTSKPNIFKRMYNAIISLANKITGNSKESLFIKDLKNKWEEAYRTQNNNLDAKEKYLTIGIKGAKNLKKNADTRYYRNLYNNQLIAEEIHDKSLDTFNNTNIKSKKETQWIKTKYGDWGTIISDKNAKIIKKLEQNKKYKLGDILKHDVLFEAYPELKKINVITSDIPSSGAFTQVDFLPANTITDDIRLKNSDINKKDFKNTLLHEIQHYIQKKESYNKNSRGANTTNNSRDEYNNNLGEMMANETKINSNLTQEQLDDIILLEQAKQYPNYDNIKERLINSNNNDFYKNRGGDNVLQNIPISIQNQVQSNKMDNKQNSKGRRINYDINDIEAENSRPIYETRPNRVARDDGREIGEREKTKATREINTEGKSKGLDNSSFSLEQRVSGDKLLDTQDLIEEIKTVGAKVDKNGYVTLYHQTTNENADKIRQTGKMFAKEPYVYFSTSENASQSDGRGNTKLEFKIPAEKLTLDDIFEDNADVKIKLDGSKELDISSYLVNDEINIDSLKEKQLKIIKNNNPVNDDYHTWIRNIEDIKTLEETINDSDWIDYDEYNPDLSRQDIENAIESGKIIVYSSYPVEQGIFVSPSKMEAESYSGNGKVYSKEVNINDVAWLDPTQGQYAKVNDTKYSQQNDKWQEYLDENYKTTGTRTNLKDIKKKEHSSINLPDNTKISKNDINLPKNPTKESSYDMEKTPTRHEIIEKNRKLARKELGSLFDIKDKTKGIYYQINTMKRNLRDIMPKEKAKRMYDTYFKTITENNAKIEINKQEYVERIQKFNLTDAESTYTQMLGELKHNPETTLNSGFVESYYEKNSNKIDKAKCERAVKEFRGIYDELIVKINKVLVENGYKPIDYRKGYFPHFIEEKATSPIGKLAEKLGWKIKKGQLPTDIAGITDQFKPGKSWTTFSQQRTGDATDYNALKGLDNYLDGAMNVIYHTEDIQKLRALENEIRYQYSEKGVQEKIDEIYNDDLLDMEEKNDRIITLTQNIRNSSLGNFVTELRNYTDNIANKKAFGDRSMEQSLGRDTYSIMQNINGRVSANMVGANISSALTNFIPITQAWSQCSSKNLMRGMYESIKNCVKDDGFSDNSTYLINRTKQAERLYKSGVDKINDKLSIPFEAIDSFTSNTIVRAKYYDNLEKGMTETKAMDNANEFAKDLMAGRSKGDMPTIFNRQNPLTKLFTAFQLEVNNQYSYMFKDIPSDLADEAKEKIVGAFIKMFFGAYLYNIFSEKITGRKSAFSPIDMAIEDLNTISDDNMNLGEKIKNIATDTAQELPFVGGMLGGGRLPIQAAIPYDNPLEMVTETFTDLGNIFDEEKKKTAIQNLKKEWSKPVYYLALPFAGGQIKKTIEGLSMYDENLPVAGSYTNSGKLRFEAPTDTLGKMQAAIFGQYASKNARDYFNNGESPLTEKQINTALEGNFSMNEYREYKKGINEVKKEAKENKTSQTEAVYNYVYNLPIDESQKNVLLNNTLGYSDTVRDKNEYIKFVDNNNKTYWYDEKNNKLYNRHYKEVDIEKIDDLIQYSNKKDISNYGDYSSLDEFNYAVKNPTKYKAIKQIANYSDYVEYKNEIEDISDEYSEELSQAITSKQKAVINNRKKRAIREYINSLDLNKYQKLMLEKIGAGYSIKNYRNSLGQYIDSLDLTISEKQDIDSELFG